MVVELAIQGYNIRTQYTYTYTIYVHMRQVYVHNILYTYIIYVHTHQDGDQVGSVGGEGDENEEPCIRTQYTYTYIIYVHTHQVYVHNILYAYTMYVRRHMYVYYVRIQAFVRILCKYQDGGEVGSVRGEGDENEEAEPHCREPSWHLPGL